RFCYLSHLCGLEIEQLKAIMVSMAITQFEKQVYDVVRRIPKGKTMTYAQVAAAIGRPRAMRAVGNALNKNPYPFPIDGGGRSEQAQSAVASEVGRGRAKSKPLSKLVPCHRVVRSDGSIGGFASGSEKKLKLLKKEGAI
ncbi:MAG TPA: MGMT family protein, partial [Candidatus Paceibacterota bacterium]|nr:MGMT family protein [Candidatus Paceibacterota bacterium]